jgi:pimeloyl-ACP methyl ester carboxylesterase
VKLGFACLTVIALWLVSAHVAIGASNDEEESALSLAELRSKYQLPASHYIEVDGVEVHYTDEGSGPAVVFAHASYNALHSWEGVTTRLRDSHRTIRFDFPNAGLTGSETKPTPPDKFHLIERNYEVLAGLVDALELDRFALVGTSSGGSVAFRYAARHTDRVERLVLINTAGMPRIPRNDPLRERPEFKKWTQMPVKPRAFWEASSSENFIAPNKAPEWWLDQVYDFNRREGALDETSRYRFSTGDPKSILSMIQAPTLIMWGKANPVVMHLEADVIQHWMTGAPSVIRKYEGLGHYPYVEDLDAVYPDLAAFLNGELDDELRRTTMVKP